MSCTDQSEDGTHVSTTPCPTGGFVSDWLDFLSEGGRDLGLRPGGLGVRVRPGAGGAGRTWGGSTQAGHRQCCLAGVGRVEVLAGGGGLEGQQQGVSP